MDSLVRLKERILRRDDCSEELESSYRAFLSEYNSERTEILISLLEMMDPSPRVNEILLVMDLIRFPVRRFEPAGNGP
jgi:hypothetical protein